MDPKVLAGMLLAVLGLLTTAFWTWQSNVNETNAETREALQKSRENIIQAFGEQETKLQLQNQKIDALLREQDRQATVLERLSDRLDGLVQRWAYPGPSYPSGRSPSGYEGRAGDGP